MSFIPKKDRRFVVAVLTFVVIMELARHFLKDLVSNEFASIISPALGCGAMVFIMVKTGGWDRK